MRRNLIMWQSFKRKFIGERDFYLYILRLAVPMIVQNAVTNFVSFLDNIMVGQIGTEQMTGVAIVNQLIFVFNLCIFGAVSGAGIFGTQYFGKGDYEGQKYAFRFKLYIGSAASALTLLLFGFFGAELISLYLNDTGGVGDIAVTLQFGERYLVVMMFGLIPYALGQIYTSSIRETGHVCSDGGKCNGRCCQSDSGLCADIWNWTISGIGGRRRGDCDGDCPICRMYPGGCLDASESG